MPINWQPIDGISSAVDVFVGYLMLDALIANQDRHHENWGLIATKSKQIHLTPIYDNASSLGRNETDVNREIILNTADTRRHITTYITKANSAFYQNPNSPKVMTSIEAFMEAQRMYPFAANVWLEQLENLDMRFVAELFNQVPDACITPMSAIFALEMLRLNRARLLQLKQGIT